MSEASDQRDQSGGTPERTSPPARDARLCARVGCAREAVATLTADYDDQMMAVGPLSPVRTPPALDLCDAHRKALRPPEGWSLLQHDPTRE